MTECTINVSYGRHPSLSNQDASLISHSLQINIPYPNTRGTMAYIYQDQHFIQSLKQRFVGVNRVTFTTRGTPMHFGLCKYNLDLCYLHIFSL